MILEEWFEHKLIDLFEYADDGGWEFINYMPDEHCYTINAEDIHKSHEIIDLFESGISFGEYAIKKKLKLYKFWYGPICFIILAKSASDLKKKVNEAIKEYKSENKPSPPPEPSEREKMQALLCKIRAQLCDVVDESGLIKNLINEIDKLT